MLNILDYRATGDGVTDDTAAFTDAMDVLEADGGGTLYMPAGEYLTAVFYVPDNVTIIGDGDGTILLAALYTPNAVIHLGRGVAGTADNVVLASFKIDARGETRQAAALGGYVRGITTRNACENIAIEGVWVHDGGSRAIEVNRSRRCQVVSCKVTNASRLAGFEGDGIHFEGAGGGCTEIIIANNHVERCGDTAIAVTCCSDVTITGNQIYGASYYATDNTPGADESGMDLYGASRVVVTGNKIRNIRQAGIVSAPINVASVDYDPSDITITDNEFSGSDAGSAHLITVSGRTGAPNARLVITGNRLDRSRAGGIALGTEVQDFVIANNVTTLPYRGGSGLAHEAGIIIGSSSGNPIGAGIVRDNMTRGDSLVGSGIYINTGVSADVSEGDNVSVGTALYATRDLRP